MTQVLFRIFAKDEEIIGIKENLAYTLEPYGVHRIDVSIGGFEGMKIDCMLIASAERGREIAAVLEKFLKEQREISWFISVLPVGETYVPPPLQMKIGGTYGT